MLVEDSPAYRKAVARSLELESDMALVSEFSTAEIALRSLEKSSDLTTPDVILLDLNLPGMSGLEAIPWVKKYSPKTQIIVLTQSDNEADVVDAISAGAAGYLLKSATRDRLDESIRTVVEGGAILDPSVARFLLRSMRQTSPVISEGSDLTERELEVLKLIGEGLTNKELAECLDISPKTVAVHAAHIYEKLNVPNAPAAVAKAFKEGLLPPGDG